MSGWRLQRKKQFTHEDNVVTKQVLCEVRENSPAVSRIKIRATRSLNTGQPKEAVELISY